MSSLDPTPILGPGGAIARRMHSYEPREEQLEMSRAVAKAIDAGGHLLVEAGTGVGKSFAYLVPAILAAAEMGKKVVSMGAGEGANDKERFLNARAEWFWGLREAFEEERQAAFHQAWPFLLDLGRGAVLRGGGQGREGERESEGEGGGEERGCVFHGP